MNTEESVSQNTNQAPKEFYQISLDPGAELPVRLHELVDKFNICFRDNMFNLVVDMGKVKLPPTKFIVALIEATSEARRMGGDIKIINISPSVMNNLVTFSPKTYLNIEPSERHALREFGETFDNEIEFDINDKIKIALPQQRGSASPKRVESKPQPAAAVQDPPYELDLEAMDKIRVYSKAENLYKICDFVLERAECAGFDERELGKIKVTVYEACLNVVEHAYFSNPDYIIDVYVDYNEERFTIVIQDWGESFEFNPSISYDVEQAVKDRRTGGFGLHIIKRTVDDIYYMSDEKLGNRLVLIKKITDNNQIIR
ncbi:MAG: ATP-binding protein [Candidatus Zhuqueibacterota bacterium]